MKPDKINRSILAVDLVWCALALLGAEILRYGVLSTVTERGRIHTFLPLLSLTIVAWMLLTSWMDLDCFRGGWRAPAVISRLFLAVSCVMGVLFSAGYLEREYVSRLALGYYGLLLLVGFVAIRYGARHLLFSRCRASRVRKVAIAGSDHIAHELALKLERHAEMACKVVGFLSPESDTTLSARGTAMASNVPTLGIAEFLASQGVNELIVALPTPHLPEVLNLVGRCRGRGISVSFVPQPYELYLSRPALLDLDGIPVLELKEVGPSDVYLRCKRACDIVLGLAFAIVALPILIPACIGLRWHKQRVLSWETRCGQRGRIFSMLRLNVDRQTAAPTGFERVLDRLSLTELPQLWNVLRGDMSLVGPRPESPERVRRYSEWQQQRLNVKPGMTGLAQVYGLRDQNSSEEKARFDLQYNLNPSPFTDMSILLQTFWTLVLRVFEYPAMVANPGEMTNLDRATTRFLRDNLPHAYRSQSGAD